MNIFEETNKPKLLIMASLFMQAFLTSALLEFLHYQKQFIIIFA